MQRRRAAGRVIGRHVLALEDDHLRLWGEMVGEGDAGDACANDGEIEFLHALTLQGLRLACNSWGP